MHDCLCQSAIGAKSAKSWETAGSGVRLRQPSRAFMDQPLSCTAFNGRARSCLKWQLRLLRDDLRLLIEWGWFLEDPRPQYCYTRLSVAGTRSKCEELAPSVKLGFYNSDRLPDSDVPALSESHRQFTSYCWPFLYMYGPAGLWN